MCTLHVLDAYSIFAINFTVVLVSQQTDCCQVTISCCTHQGIQPNLHICTYVHTHTHACTHAHTGTHTYVDTHKIDRCTQSENNCLLIPVLYSWNPFHRNNGKQESCIGG